MTHTKQKRMPWARRSAKSLRPYVPQVRQAALAQFADRFPNLQLAPVVVVIAAYTEDESIGSVLTAIPREACGLPVDTLVVDDGSADDTSKVALGHGVYVATLERNCGHGVALRVGYELARRCGARYIVTLDADGQWDPDEIPEVLGPVVRDEADFVIGSRVLGGTETDDSFRHAGVHVFGALVRLLTGANVTDTSSGFRAMRADVTGTVRQEQVQYQSSELLIGAIFAGYRVTERPVIMRKRIAGVSKKGHNLLYGLRYARVILRTWWRERRADHSRALATPPPEEMHTDGRFDGDQALDRAATEVHQPAAEIRANVRS
jgi:glycosyltransferase involved in cell wall biosynthesis